jgi:hypothetical protein
MIISVNRKIAITDGGELFLRSLLKEFVFLAQLFHLK